MEEAIRLQPGYAEALSLRAMLLWQKKLLEEALFSFSEALKYALDCQLRASLWYNKGLILTEMQRYDEALSYFDESIRLYGSFYGSYNNKGVTLGFLGRHDEAIEFFDRAVQLSEDDTGPLSNRALANIKTGRELLGLLELIEDKESYCNNISCICIWYFSKLFYNFSQPDYKN